MFRRFGIGTRRVLEAAEEHARGAGATSVGVGHLFAALTESLGIDAAPEPAPASLIPRAVGPLRYDVQVLALLRDAFRLSVEIGDSLVLPGHVLLAALNSDNPEVNAGLDQMGPDAAALRLAAVGSLHPLGAEEEPNDVFDGPVPAASEIGQEAPHEPAGEGAVIDQPGEPEDAAVVPVSLAAPESAARRRRRRRGVAHASPVAVTAVVLALFGLTVGGVLVAVVTPSDDSELSPSVAPEPTTEPPPAGAVPTPGTGTGGEVNDGDGGHADELATESGGATTLDQEPATAITVGARRRPLDVVPAPAPQPPPAAAAEVDMPGDLASPETPAPPTLPRPRAPRSLPEGSTVTTSTVVTSTTTTTTTSTPIPPLVTPEDSDLSGARGAHERHADERQGCGQGHERFGDPCPTDAQPLLPPEKVGISRREAHGGSRRRGRRPRRRAAGTPIER